MPVRLNRLLAVCAAAVLVLLGSAVPAAAAPPTCDGVWVVVQPDQKDAGSVQARCAASYGTGLAALKSAGFATEVSGSVLNRIDGLPKDTDFNTNGGYYWSYWSAAVKADGTLGDWSYYQVGPGASKPKPGTVEGWLLTNEQKPAGPALKTVPQVSFSPAASPSATPTAPAPAGSSPVGTIVAGIVVVVAVVGLGVWWVLRRGRTR